MRQNTGRRHKEGKTRITSEHKAAASLANPVDEALHEFVSATFCSRLREMGFMNHHVVVEELAADDLLEKRYTPGIRFH